MSNMKIWRESATLIITAKSAFSTPNPFNYKLLCLKRSSKSNFMPGTYVFPGGHISSSDSDERWLSLYENSGFSLQSFQDLRPTENIPEILTEDSSVPKALSFRICAIRETFEECGILLCRSPKLGTDAKWASFLGGGDVARWQHLVHDDPGQFLQLCKEFHVVPDVWALKNWALWRTPRVSPTNKFKAVFFLACLHQPPMARKDEREMQDLMWTTPQEAIEMNKGQSVLLPPPQFYEISRLNTIKDINELADFAHDRSKCGFETYWPRIVLTEKGRYTILPGDELYEEISPEITEITTLQERETQSRVKNRIFHLSAYDNCMQTENLIPKCKHIVPPSETVPMKSSL